ncbi:MAG: CoA transferase [marine bacterium B5-7]|nr:MAG: CoA transferase [marine bacterium B5-7]
MTRPLEGMTVVSVEQAVAAPLASARLRDAGARVIKVEREEGDFARGYDQAARGDSSYFVWLNQGKESVIIDFKTHSGAKSLWSLIESADVFIQNLAPGALQRAGFGRTELRTRCPSLIVCEISGYGDSDEMRSMRAYDLLVQAESGLASISGGPNEIGRIGVSICDIGAGMTAHAAILEALIRRQHDGSGAVLSVSLFDVAAEWMTVPLIHNDYGAGPPTRQGLRHPSIAPYGVYTTGEGIQTLISIQNEREWQRLCSRVLERGDLAYDPRFIDNNSRVSQREALDDEIQEILSFLDAATFRQRLKDHAIAFGAVNGVPELSTHSALRRRMAGNTSGQVLPIPDHPVIWQDETWRDASQGCSSAPALGNNNIATPDNSAEGPESLISGKGENTDRDG